MSIAQKEKWETGQKNPWEAPTSKSERQTWLADLCTWAANTWRKFVYSILAAKNLSSWASEKTVKRYFQLNQIHTELNRWKSPVQRRAYKNVFNEKLFLLPFPSWPLIPKII